MLATALHHRRGGGGGGGDSGSGNTDDEHATTPDSEPAVPGKYTVAMLQARVAAAEAEVEVDEEDDDVDERDYDDDDDDVDVEDEADAHMPPAAVSPPKRGRIGRMQVRADARAGGGGGGGTGGEAGAAEGWLGLRTGVGAAEGGETPTTARMDAGVGSGEEVGGPEAVVPAVGRKVVCSGGVGGSSGVWDDESEDGEEAGAARRIGGSAQARPRRLVGLDEVDDDEDDGGGVGMAFVGRLGGGGGGDNGDDDEPLFSDGEGEESAGAGHGAARKLSLATAGVTASGGAGGGGGGGGEAWSGSEEEDGEGDEGADAPQASYPVAAMSSEAGRARVRRSKKDEVSQMKSETERLLRTTFVAPVIERVIDPKFSLDALCKRFGVVPLTYLASGYVELAEKRRAQEEAKRMQEDGEEDDEEDGEVEQSLSAPDPQVPDVIAAGGSSPILLKSEPKGVADEEPPFAKSAPAVVPKFSPGGVLQSPGTAGGSGKRLAPPLKPDRVMTRAEYEERSAAIQLAAASGAFRRAGKGPARTTVAAAVAAAIAVDSDEDLELEVVEVVEVMEERATSGAARAPGPVGKPTAMTRDELMAKLRTLAVEQADARRAEEAAEARERVEEKRRRKEERRERRRLAREEEAAAAAEAETGADGAVEAAGTRVNPIVLEDDDDDDDADVGDLGDGMVLDEEGSHDGEAETLESEDEEQSDEADEELSDEDDDEEGELDDGDDAGLKLEEDTAAAVSGAAGSTTRSATTQRNSMAVPRRPSALKKGGIMDLFQRAAARASAPGVEEDAQAAELDDQGYEGEDSPHGGEEPPQDENDVDRAGSDGPDDGDGDADSAGAVEEEDAAAADDDDGAAADDEARRQRRRERRRRRRERLEQMRKSRLLEAEAEEEEDEFMGMDGPDEDDDSDESSLVCSGDEDEIEDFDDVVQLH
ncbi:hypothetical protein HK405_007924, partial [Cladochytrium tenue]